MLRRTAVMIVSMALGATPAIGVQSASAQTTRPSNVLTIPVSGSVNSATSTMVGTLTINRFASQNGVLTAMGNLTSTVLDPNTTGVPQIPETVMQQVALPVAVANGTCSSLRLELRPADFTLPNRAMHLDGIVVEIVAPSATSGSALANLLCQIGTLLDAGTFNATLMNLLNQLPATMAGV